MPPNANFNALFTVFLRTVIFTFLGFVFSYVLIVAWNYLGLPEGDDVGLILLPLFTLGSGIAYIMYAKKKIGNNWHVGVGGIIGFFLTAILLLFVLSSIS